MEATMTPRDIQLRIRSGESLADVIAASGMPAERVEAFAAPILAERDHTTATALSAPVRRRGETASARRLRQTVAESLLDRGQDIDFVTWDSWRRSDGRWIVQGTWIYLDQDRCARFLYDSRGRFSIADNDQARVLVGDLPLAASTDMGSETTVEVVAPSPRVQSDLTDETTVGLSYEIADEDESEDSLRTDINLLYDMISTIDEDSVRIFRMLRDPLAPHPEKPHPPLLKPYRHNQDVEDQPPLIQDATPPPDTDAPEQEGPRPRKKRKRASVPSWDDIIFGGQS